MSLAAPAIFGLSLSVGLGIGGVLQGLPFLIAGVCYCIAGVILSLHQFQDVGSSGGHNDAGNC